MKQDKRRIILGSDLGTGSCKGILADEAGNVLAKAEAVYACSYPGPGQVEQDPREWYRAFCTTAHRLMQESDLDPRYISAICVVGVTHIAVLLDRKGEILRPAIHYWDRRSLDQARRIKTRWGAEVRERALNEVDALWTWPQLMWVKENEPHTWERISLMLFPKDYVRQQLAGSPLTDSIDPVGTLLYDPTKSRWIQPFIEDLGLSPSVLPEIRSPFSVAGRLNRQAAADSGLVEGTQVITGTTDTAAELLGAGAVQKGQAVVKLASVGRIMMVADNPLDHPSSLNYPHVIQGLWYPGSVTKHAGSAYRWLRRMLWGDNAGEDIYRRMDEEAAQIPAGSGGVTFHPHLSGEYAPQWDPKALATFSGLSIEHSRAHLTRAVLEGVAFQIKSAIDQLLRAGVGYEEIRLIGGGANSDLWRQIMADVLNTDLLVPAQRSAAFGAAILGGMAISLISGDPEDLRQSLPLEKVVDTSSKRSPIYREVYSKFVELSSMLPPISNQIGTLKGESSGLSIDD